MLYLYRAYYSSFHYCHLMSLSNINTIKFIFSHDKRYTFCMILVFAALCEYALVNVLSCAEIAALKAAADKLKMQNNENEDDEDEEDVEAGSGVPFDPSQDTIVVRMK